MFVMKRTVLTILALFISAFAYGQGTTITGTVIDSTDGQPLPGVNIVVQGTNTGTTTNMDGEYKLTVPQGNEVLVFSFLGYQTQQIQINGRNTIDVAMRTQAQALEEMVVVGYGTKQKSLVTGSISTISSEDFETMPIQRAEEALQGKTSGVTVLPTSGSPGAGMQVRIRGTSSNQSSQPLYIVDGMKTGDISNISPSDISSIEVLKDAASAAIYGAEGANGVVLISTKSGQSGQSEVTYRFQYGTQQPGNVPEPMNANQYRTYLQEAGQSVTTPDYNNANTDWVDETFDTAPMQKHYLSVSGGNQKSTYMLSGSFFNQEGIVGGDKSQFDRYSVRLNTQHDVKDWLEVGNHLAYTNFNRSAIAENTEFGGVVTSAMTFDPLVPVTYDNTPSIIQNAIDAGNSPVTDGNGNYYGVSPNTQGESANPLGLIKTAKGYTEQDKILGNVYARINPIDELQVTSRLGIDYASQLYHTWTPNYWFNPENLSTSTSVRDNQDRWYTWLWENFAEYKDSYENHNYSIMAGVSAERYRHKYLTTLSGPLFKEGEDFAQHGETEIDGKLSGSEDITTQSSFFTRLSYDYNGKYLVEAAFRRDGSSLLADGNRWGNFPSVSLGWVVTEEDFWTLDAITHLKVRGSWGQNGSLSNLSPHQYRSLITRSGITYPDASDGSYSGAEPDILANPELQWETSTQTNFGIELRTLSDRLTFSADYYNKVTEDLLTPSSPPLSVGNDAPFVNAGDVTNEGFEFELGFTDTKGDFNYNLNFNASLNDNEVTYLNPLLERVAGANIGVGWTATSFAENKPVWYFRGYETNGIFQSQAQIDQYVQNNGLVDDSGAPTYTPSPGDPIVANTNGDNLINPEDQTQIGNPHPDVLLGANFNFNYKNFDLGIAVSGQLGHDVLMGFNRSDRATYNRPEFFYEDRWTGEGSTNDWPSANLTDPYFYNSDLMVFDGSYVRIRQIELGYSLPTDVSTRLGIKRARLFVSLNNYFTFTNYPGMDPAATSGNSVQSMGIDRGYYPLSKKIMTGISINI